MSDDPKQIEEDLENTRARLSQNLGELGDRMSPGNIVDEALRYFETGPKEFAGTLGSQVQKNPMATLVTAAGLAWLAMGRNADKPRVGHGGDVRSDTSIYHLPDGENSDVDSDLYSRDLTYRETFDRSRSEIASGSLLDEVRNFIKRETNESDTSYYKRLDDSYASKLSISRRDDEDEETYRVRIRSAVDATKQKAEAARNAIRASASDARQRLGVVSSQAGAKATQAKDKAAEFHDENPLVSGAIAIAVGALAGSLFPTTKQEREALEPITDDLVKRGSAVASDLAERGAELAEQGTAKVGEVAASVEARADKMPSRVKEFASAKAS